MNEGLVELLRDQIAQVVDEEQIMTPREGVNYQAEQWEDLEGEGN